MRKLKVVIYLSKDPMTHYPREEVLLYHIDTSSLITTSYVSVDF